VSAGGVINTGAIVSLIVITWVALVVFPHESVIVHVLVIVAGHDPEIGESVPITVPVPAQLSV
jgi:hypothetical protein